jgi:hypothetical protein
VNVLPIRADHSGRFDTEIVGSNPTGGMDVCVRSFCGCVVLCVGSGLSGDDHPSKESYRRIRKTEKEAKAQKKGCRA